MAVQKSFENFTQKYALSKTLRFKLIPTPDTSRMLVENKVFDEDQKTERSVQKNKAVLR
jgi:CRISPR-associated protein Cpf1